jgi:protein TonB
MDGQSTSPARAAVDVIAITTRDDFLLELGQALGGQASVTPVESVAQALEQLAQAKKRPQILAVDSRDSEDVRSAVDTLNTQAPQAAILIFAEGHDESDVAAKLKGSQVFAVLCVPVDIPKTSAVFEGAVTEVKSKQTAPRSAVVLKPTIVVEAVASAAPEPIRPEPRDGGEGKFNLRAAGGVALAVLAAVTVWFLTRGGGTHPEAAAVKTIASPTPTAAEKAPAIETSVVKGKVDELLEKAREAMRERRYTEPSGDNALLYYRSAAYADSANGEALDGLNRVASVLIARFEEAMSANQHEEASLTLAQLKSAVPNDARLEELQTRLNKLHADAQRAEQEEARQKRLAEQQAAREAAAVEQKKLRETKAAAAEAERQAQLAREKEQQEKLKQEQAAKAAEAAKMPAKAASPQRSAGSLQRNLKRKRYVAPDYPQDLFAKGIGGVVTVAFTVNVKGEPTDVTVESSDPANVFDRAATDAVKRWRYEPLLIDGVPTEIPMRLAIRFAP